MMSVKKVQQFELSDVKAVTTECKECGCRESRSLDDWKNAFMSQCPNCRATRMVGEGLTDRAIRDLVKGAIRLRTVEEHAAEARIRLFLEIEAPE